jgi:acetyl-CoA C-acetyltransferase
MHRKTRCGLPQRPSLAIPKALKVAGVNAKDVGFYEINEAFSAVAIGE